MYDTSPQNMVVPSFIRISIIIECLVAGIASTILFFLPALGKNIWAWSAPPFNARYIGAIYYAALLPLVVFAIAGRWSPGRLVLWMIFAFTTSIGVVMFIHIPNFDWTRPAAYAFWIVFIYLSTSSAFFLYRLRGWIVSDSENTPAAYRTLLLGVTIVYGLYGIALLITPEAAASFWPWKIDAFHGRIYAATFITPALGAWIIHQRGAATERFVLGLPLLTLGVLSLIGVIWTSATVPAANQVNYASLGTWGFLGMNVISALVGFGLITSARK